MANIMQMMAKAQKLKSKMAEMQEKVRATDVDGQAGNGMVTCRMTGKFELKQLKINPSVTSDIEMMEDLVIAAVNDARQKAENMMNEETQKLMSELGLPPGLDLPF